jgi:predicted ABC-class ATPase
MEKLKQILRDIDHRGYKAYKQMEGLYSFPTFTLCIDHVQGDPFAEPSRCRILIDKVTAAISKNLYSNPVRQTALEDYLGRMFGIALKKYTKGERGSGKSGVISIASYGQQVLKRNAVIVENGSIDLRFQIGLPADGRSINSDQANEMLFYELPKVVSASLLSLQSKKVEVTAHVDTVEDQQYLREQLTQNGLIAFVGDGSILPRLSGIDDHPLEESVPTLSPKTMAVKLKRLHAKPIRGLGIPQGISLIVGGGFHGKSTLLHAIEYGVYNHIKGDGRELVVTDPSACKIRAEDGRTVTGIDISCFINNLPQGKDTHSFSTQNASGSTSQAANIMEALSTNAKTLLVDEDTSATNFMIRDQRMQRLVSKDKEPITPLVQQIRNLYENYGVSVVLVMGGSGDFFSVADHILMLDSYQIRDLTTKAHALADKTFRNEQMNTITQSTNRIPKKSCLYPKNRTDKLKIQAYETKSLRYGTEEIDLSRVEQLVDKGQVHAIGYLIYRYHQSLEHEQSDMVQTLGKILEQVEIDGLDSITPYTMGTMAMPRLHELLATINRMRNLKLVTV